MFGNSHNILRFQCQIYEQTLMVPLCLNVHRHQLFGVVGSCSIFCTYAGELAFASEIPNRLPRHIHGKTKCPATEFARVTQWSGQKYHAGEGQLLHARGRHQGVTAEVTTCQTYHETKKNRIHVTTACMTQHPYTCHNFALTVGCLTTCSLTPAC